MNNDHIDDRDRKWLSAQYDYYSSRNKGKRLTRCLELLSEFMADDIGREHSQDWQDRYQSALDYLADIHNQAIEM